MKQILSWKKLPLLVLAIGVVVTVSVAQSNSATQHRSINDTIPSKQKKIRNLDDALADIDRSEIEIQRALKEIDHDKIEKEVRQAMKTMEVDMAKMKEDIEKAMKEIDVQKINAEVQKALKEVDSEKIQKEMESAMAKVDMQKVKAEMEKAKSIDLSRMKEELANIQPQVEKAMKEAQVSIEKARKEITAYKNLLDALERDGHLKKDSEYKVSYRNGQLTINGKTLSADETKKYSSLLSEMKEFTLENNEDGVEIDH